MGSTAGLSVMPLHSSALLGLGTSGSQTPSSTGSITLSKATKGNRRFLFSRESTCRSGQQGKAR